MKKFLVPRYDYASQFDGLEEAILDQFRRTLVGGTYILSPDVSDFESALGRAWGHEHVVGVNSGTDALMLSLLALGVGAGDEVVVPANTFHATAAAVAQLGGRVRLADADEDTYLASPDSLLAAVTDRTRAVIAVHLYGKCVPLGALGAKLKERGIALIEDAAQAHGSRAADGDPLGAHSDAVCYSFHPSKNLAAAGDAGAVATNRGDVAERIRVFRNLGQRVQNEHLTIGYNSKLDALQAIVLRAKLPRLEAWNARRIELANQYHQGLAGLPLTWQALDAGEHHTYHLFQVRTARRDALRDFLHAAGVDAVVRYPDPIHRQAAFADIAGYPAGAFPVAERLCAELIALPLFPSMMEEQVQIVVRQVRAFFEAMAR